MGESIPPRGNRKGPWSRDDALLVLASYVQRPRGSLLPPAAERERLASVLRRDLGAITDRLWMFAGLDPDNPSDGHAAGETEARLWLQYGDNRLALLLAADDIMNERRRLPRGLQPRDGAGP